MWTSFEAGPRVSFIKRNLRNIIAVIISTLYDIYISISLSIYIYLSKIFCLWFQKVPLKSHTKYLTHTLKEKLIHKAELLWDLTFKSSWSFLKQFPVCGRAGECHLLLGTDQKPTGFVTIDFCVQYIMDGDYSQWKGVWYWEPFVGGLY